MLESCFMNGTKYQYLGTLFNPCFRQMKAIDFFLTICHILTNTMKANLLQKKFKLKLGFPDFTKAILRPETLEFKKKSLV